MKVRNKANGSEGYSNTFNVHALSEIIVCFLDSDCSSEFISDYEVYLESKQEYMDMLQAFKEKLIITDNYNTNFREPKDDQERERGWY